MARRILLLTVAACLAGTAFARDDEAIDPEKMTKTDSGLRYKDTKKGEGTAPEAGQTCVMHYTGWLWEGGKKGSRPFDSSRDRDEPFQFRIGEGMVIKGWDEGVKAMKPGGKRLLLIPPELAYGADGAGGVIPGNATLLFEVELLRVE
jgi:peptidylprolyl isomerase